MEMRNSKHHLFSKLPKMDTIIDLFKDSPIQEHWVKIIGTEVLDRYRDRIKNGEIDTIEVEHIIHEIESIIDNKLSSQLKGVINGSGVVIHTNLGRSPISEMHFKSIADKLIQYNNLEFDLKSGKRGSRYNLVKEKLCMLTGAEDAIVVNNNASAVLLILSALAQDRRAIVSRGELVEIGGSFRIPDVMKLSGCELVEVGTTNKTHLSDYEKAINENTAMIMKVHTSNYKIMGFTESVPTESIYPICRQNEIILYEDLGSGLLRRFEHHNFCDEPLVSENVNHCDILSFSGDKLLGGPQSGIILGKRNIIKILKNHQLLRALRIDKFSLALLDEILNTYFKKDNFFTNELPVAKYLNRSKAEIEIDTCHFVAKASKEKFNKILIEAIDMATEIGAGSMPLKTLPSFGISVTGNFNSEYILKFLRDYETPIIGRIENERVLLDFRTIEVREYHMILEAFKALNQGGYLE